jgi:hypothetical protein
MLPSLLALAAAFAAGPPTSASGGPWAGGLRHDYLSGNTFASSAVLHEVIGDTDGKWISLYTAQERLTPWYRGHGFLDVSAFVFFGNFGTSIVAINEGTRYKVAGRPRVTGDDIVPVAELEALITLKEGAFYDQKAVDRDRERIRVHLGHAGRDVYVREEIARVEGKPGLAEVNYHVGEGPIACLRQFVHRSGEGHGLRRPPAPNPYRTIRVDVRQGAATAGSLRFGLGFNSDAGFTGSVVLNERGLDLETFGIRLLEDCLFCPDASSRR